MSSMTSSSKKTTTKSTDDHYYYDVIIIGAGISGISAAHHVQTLCPQKTYRILERRSQLGGTWDLLDYPGLRSDSDMYTFGFGWRPWKSTSIIGTKQTILTYLNETVQECNIHIDYGIRMDEARWNSQQAQWTLSGVVEDNNNHDTPVTYRSQYVFMCTGYYDYQQGYVPEFPGVEEFRGPIVRPQHWPRELDVRDQRVVVIGSGATAVTILPAMTQKGAKHVTMLQRSPTYMFARPTKMLWVPRKLLEWFGPHVTRWYYILFGMLSYNICKVAPAFMKRRLKGMVAQQLGDGIFRARDWDVRYDPWDQRLCVCPDGDLFEALKSRTASIVTDRIVEITKTGIKLEHAPEELPADIIVTATGLQLLFGGGMDFYADDKKIDIPSKFVYKGFMANSVPNLFVCGGYTNASWTLKVDLTNRCACRLIRHADRHRHRYFQPEVQDESKMKSLPLLDLTSGYVQRSMHMFPKQSNVIPWRLYQNYLYDKYVLEYTSLQDSFMKFYK